MVTRVSQTFQLSRAELGVCASPNGFVWGRVQINSKHSTHLTEHAIPDESQVKSIYSDAAWVLIVEKHAIYQTLRSIEFLDRGKTYGVHVPGAVVTGKGYPDRATRSFLATWASNRRAPRLFFLMDADPHGVDILRVYSEALKGVQVHWIGLRVQQWLALSQAHPFSIVPLNGSDRSKAMHICRNDTVSVELQHELAHQIHIGYKCELEVLCSSHRHASGILAQFIYTEIRAVINRADESHDRRRKPSQCQEKHLPVHLSDGGDDPSRGLLRHTPQPSQAPTGAARKRRRG